MSEADGTPKHRMFVAVELPDEWREELSRFRRELEPVGGNDLKWVRSDLLHITLIFLGYQPENSLQPIDEALSAASRGIHPFRLALGHLGCFGQPFALRVIWVGLADVPEGLGRLHAAIADHLQAESISFDRKPLVPHITLARSRPSLRKDTSLRIFNKFQKLQLSSVPPLDVFEFVLMESHLSRQGPDYQPVRRFPLSTDML